MKQRLGEDGVQGIAKLEIMTNNKDVTLRKWTSHKEDTNSTFYHNRIICVNTLGCVLQCVNIWAQGPVSPGLKMSQSYDIIISLNFNTS